MMMSQSSQIESTPGAGGYVSQNTQSSKKVENHAMYPVTAKQIVEAKSSLDANFLIDGANVSNVKLVGMVYDISERNSDFTFVIDDGTGRIPCTRWIHDNDAHDSKEVGYLKNGVYVRIHGNLKTFGAKTKLLVVYAIRPVKDHSEIASHFLECIHSHCYNVKLQIQSNRSARKTATTTVVNTLVGSQVNTPVESQVNTPIGSQAISSSLVDNMGDIPKMVNEYLLQPSITQDGNGVHISEIAHNLKLSEEKIKDALVVLYNEGLVYSTVDDFHYKTSTK